MAKIQVYLDDELDKKVCKIKFDKDINSKENTIRYIIKNFKPKQNK